MHFTGKDGMLSLDSTILVRAGISGQAWAGHDA